MAIPGVNNQIEHITKSSRNACAVNGMSGAISETEQAENSNRQHNHSLIYQSLGWSDTRSLSFLETLLKEESEFDWRAYSRDELQIIVQSNQKLQLQLLNNQNECTPPQLESMEAMSGLPTTLSFAVYPGEDELIQLRMRIQIRGITAVF
ncbi:hypothetical protein ACTFIW_000027 [Dictyostelium discoideum]